MTSQSFPNSRYTVGWVSALAIELTVAKGMLDEVHGPPQTPQNENDKNTYFLGRMGAFYVVIACLPSDEIGPSPAATVAKSMLFTFPNIRVGLMVGIGAGIPGFKEDGVSEEEDIRLGDVVVSSDRATGGVVAYDFGKRLADGSFQQAYALNRPPRSISSAIVSLQSEHEMTDSKIPEYIEEMLQNYPKMRKAYTSPGQSHDNLFQAQYTHPSAAPSCVNCDTFRRIPRNERENSTPVIHYGVIATGSTVVKHPPTRDEIRLRHGAKCIEMEAAGLMNNFPCVVIRGISDYADSHKNDRWQRYAAATAAACAKELLGTMRSTELEAEEKAKDLLNQVSIDVKELNTKVSKINAATDSDRKCKILDWLCPNNYGNQQHEFYQRRTIGTGEWLLRGLEFQLWINTKKSTLFCTGMPGAGKTIMASIVINHLLELCEHDPSTKVLFLYFNYQQKNQQSLRALYASILRQLLQGHATPLPESLTELYEQCQRTAVHPGVDQILKTLNEVLRPVPRVFLILDAMDEFQAQATSQDAFLSRIFEIQNDQDLRLFATSRPLPEITPKFQQAIRLDIEATTEDVRKYVETEVDSMLVLRSRPDLKPEVVSTVTSKCSGMFLLAKLHIQSLQEQITVSGLINELNRLGSGIKAYEEAYNHALKRIQGHGPVLGGYGIQILSWVICARKQLTALELQHALSITDQWQAKRTLCPEDLPDINHLLSICAGLVTIHQDNTVGLFHYTAQEYFQERWTGWFPNAHGEIASACLNYLSLDANNEIEPDEQDDFWEMRWIKSSYGKGFPASSIIDKHLPLYRYAVQNIGYHSQLCPPSYTETDQAIQRLGNISVCSCLVFSSNWWRGAGEMHSLHERSVDRTLPIMNRIHLAACLGLGHILQYLLQSGYSVNNENLYGQTPLWLAVCEGHEAAVEVLLKNGSNPNRKDTLFGQTPVSWAARLGMLSMVELLLKHHADPYHPVHSKIGRDRFASPNWVPLYWAVWSNNIQTVRLLLEHMEVTPQYLGRQQQLLQQAILIASGRGDLQMWQFLLDKGSNIDLNGKLNMDLLLRQAAKDENLLMVDFLMGRGAHPVGDILCCAFSESSEGRAIVDRFLPYVDRLDLNTGGMNSFLEIASINSWDDILETLFEKGRFAQKECLPGEIPILFVIKQYIRSRGRLGRAAKSYLEKKNQFFDLNSQDHHGYCALSYAAKYGFEEAVQLLLANQVEIDLKDGLGCTPLFHLCMSYTTRDLAQSATIASILISAGADVNTTDVFGCTPLHLTNQRSIALILIENGALINVRCDEGRTPLSYAAEFNYTDVVELLLEHGADTQTCDDHGRSPLSYGGRKKQGALLQVYFQRYFRRSKRC